MPGCELEVHHTCSSQAGASRRNVQLRALRFTAARDRADPSARASAQRMQRAAEQSAAAAREALSKAEASTEKSMQADNAATGQAAAEARAAIQRAATRRAIHAGAAVDRESESEAPRGGCRLGCPARLGAPGGRDAGARYGGTVTATSDKVATTCELRLPALLPLRPSGVTAVKRAPGSVAGHICSTAAGSLRDRRNRVPRGDQGPGWQARASGRSSDREITDCAAGSAGVI
jgi:hypothetical protein